MNWEGGAAERMLLIRGPHGQPVATIAVDGSGTAFATVIHNGKTQRMNHADLLAAQAWCAGVLAGTAQAEEAHRAATGLRARGTGTTLPKTSGKPPVVPKGAPLERLLVVLRKDPKLAWALSKSLAVLRPWTPLPESPDNLGRIDPQGRLRGRLIPGERRYTLSVTDPHGATKDYDLSGEDVVQRADAILEATGYILLYEDPDV